MGGGAPHHEFFFEVVSSNLMTHFSFESNGMLEGPATFNPLSFSMNLHRISWLKSLRMQSAASAALSSSSVSPCRKFYGNRFSNTV